MNCEVARDLAALAASGELTGAEQSAFEVHVAGCAACRAEANAFGELLTQLAEMRTESAPAPVYAAVRARVAGKIVERRRPGWLAAWPAFVAVVACSVMLVVLLHPTASVPVPRHLAQTEEGPPVGASAQYEAPVVHRPMQRRARRTVARATPRDTGQPLVVHMLTNDPDVVIYWIADAKHPGTEKETMQ